MNRITWLFRLLAITLLAIPLAQADPFSFETPLGELTLKGFGTAGMARSDDDNAQFVRDLSQPNGLEKRWSGKLDSVFGLQANLALTPQTEAVVQGITRYRYDASWQPELSWAFLRHNFTPDFSVRLGRLGTEFYMLADSRLVGYANMTIRPPADYYGPLVMSYVDGADASLTRDIGIGLLRGKVFAGKAAETSPFAASYVWNLSGSPMFGARLDYLNGPWQVSAGRSQIRFKHHQPMAELAGFDIVGAAPELSVMNRWAIYDSLGVVYDSGRLQVHGQASRIRYETEAYEDTYSAYLIAGYRIGQTTPYIGYSRVFSEAINLTTPLPPVLATAIRDFTLQTHSNQHTITLGLRWDFMQNLALKGQLDLVRGKPGTRFPMRNGNTNWDGDMNVFSLALDFVF